MQNGNDLLILLIILAVVAAVMMPRRMRLSNSAHGTARWSDASDLKRAGMLKGPGLVLGRIRDGIVRMKRYVHLAVFAPAGAGKGVSLVIPWLLTYRRGSCVVLDPKGENYRLTHVQRMAMGQKVIRLDPFGVCGPGGDCFNPLDLIGGGPECMDDCRALAEAMVKRTGMEHEPFWHDQAANLITAGLGFLCTTIKAEERNLISLREIISRDELCNATVQAMREKGGTFARMAGIIEQLQSKEEGGSWSKTGAGVLSTVHQHTGWLESEPIGQSVSKSTFDARALLNNNMTVYVILPPHQLEAQARWLRLVIASFIRLIGREGEVEGGKEILLLLDEAGQLGHMPALDQGITLLRGYGLRMALFFQSIGQLHETFKGKESIVLDNCEQVFFGVNSPETAERVSKMLGTKTLAVGSANQGESRTLQHSDTGGKGGASTNHSAGMNWSVHARELLKPDEVLRLSSEYLIAFLRDMPPIICRRIKWYQDAAFGGCPPLQPVPLVFWLLLAAAVGLLAWQLWAALVP